MVARIDRRKEAYQFILDKIKKLEADFVYKTNKSGEVSDIVPLLELDKIRRGIADPSLELIIFLKKLLRPVASEVEIEAKLLKPFQPRTPSPK